jgi:hypothetical protein
MRARLERFRWPVKPLFTSFVRTVICLGAALALVGTGCGSRDAGQQSQTQTPQSSAGPAPSVDWAAVEGALGVPLQVEDEVRHADIPRDDLHVMVGNVAVAPGMELATDASFTATGAKNALLVGEITVVDSEQQKVIDALQHGGLLIAAIHKHQPAQTPNLWWVHFVGYGDAVAEASALHTAITSTATPLPP